MTTISRHSLSPYGLHRVLDARMTLPQSAHKLDNRLPIFENEILLDVERLNLDAASFVQMEEETGGDLAKIGDIVLQNTRSHGKQQNRVTGSGGMLLGTVKQIGKKYAGPLKAKVGDKVATLVSLTLTPLHLEEIHTIFPAQHQMAVKGHAILFEKSIAALMPKDIPEPIALAAYDVAGAPAWASHLTKPGMRVVVLGAGGKSGILSCAAIRAKLKRSGKLIGVEPGKKAAHDLDSLKYCDSILPIDATDPVKVMEEVERVTKGKMADLVMVVTSVLNTEKSALLSVAPKGKIVFFSMATSFPKVTLGAEGIALTAQLIFGNGFFPGHANFTLSLLRKDPKLMKVFASRYGA